jgi:hypothetical protein
MEEVLLEFPHIRLVRSASGEYCLIVEDAELNDFVEDFLWDDYEYQATSVSVQGNSKPAVYYNYFDAAFNVDELISSLKQLDLTEAERIYRLNNPTN